MKKEKRLVLILIGILLQMILVVPGVFAKMNEISDKELSEISAQAGIDIYLGLKVNIAFDSIRFSDTDSATKNWIEFNNFSISGDGGFFDTSSPTGLPCTIDIGTGTVGGLEKTMIDIGLTDHINPRIWTTNNFVFCNQDLGKIVFDTSTVDPVHLVVASHAVAGSCGIDFEVHSKWLTNDFQYTYNDAGDSLHLTGIHLSEGVGSTDNPADPSTWVFDGAFQVGDIWGGTINPDPSPATFDVSTNTASSTTSMIFNLPLKGTIRTESVNLGGNDFGPVAIDGINAHHLYVVINPGN